jgi:hypothetical protein
LTAGQKVLDPIIEGKIVMHKKGIKKRISDWIVLAQLFSYERLCLLGFVRFVTAT